jgi:hypothetical protein
MTVWIPACAGMTAWIPACAGMTQVVAGMTDVFHHGAIFNPLTRSRPSGISRTPLSFGL